MQPKANGGDFEAAVSQIALLHEFHLDLPLTPKILI